MVTHAHFSLIHTHTHIHFSLIHTHTHIIVIDILQLVLLKINKSVPVCSQTGQNEDDDDDDYDDDDDDDDDIFISCQSMQRTV